MQFGALIAAFFILFTCFYLPDYADAARLGGGGSFGGRPQMSRPAATPGQREATMEQKPETAVPQTEASSDSRKGSMENLSKSVKQLRRLMRRGRSVR